MMPENKQDAPIDYMRILKERSIKGLLNERVLEEIEPLCPPEEEREIEPTYESIMVEIFGHI